MTRAILCSQKFLPNKRVANRVEERREVDEDNKRANNTDEGSVEQNGIENQDTIDGANAFCVPALENIVDTGEVDNLRTKFFVTFQKEAEKGDGSQVLDKVRLTRFL